MISTCMVVLLLSNGFTCLHLNFIATRREPCHLKENLPQLTIYLRKALRKCTGSTALARTLRLIISTTTEKAMAK
jgi:hypothetical protein